ncbi:MAG: hypothetical protein ABSE77_13070 [Acidimicrobiales bacterium]|jgi:hypothetical protein
MGLYDQLAASLSAESKCLGAHGRWPEALAAAEEAVIFYDDAPLRA